jgi:hypothetical protein
MGCFRSSSAGAAIGHCMGKGSTSSLAEGEEVEGVSLSRSLPEGGVSEQV